MTPLEQFDHLIRVTNATIITHVRKEWVGKDVKMKGYGEYHGRIGRIFDVSVISGYIRFLVHPYRLNNKGEIIPESFLTDRPGARSYWAIDQLEFLPQ